VPDTPSITIVKSFTYRGIAEEFSNTYHFSGTTPANEAAWKTLADAIFAAEKLTVTNAVTFVAAYGYEAGNENSVAQLDYRVAPYGPPVSGTHVASGQLMPGDVAATARWWTGVSSSRGKKVYCRKYFHGIDGHNTTRDLVEPSQKTKLETYCAKLIDGTLPGSFKYCGPQGAVLSAPTVSAYLTTRTLKRRGRRPPTSP
jgi:hypothetical protein